MYFTNCTERTQYISVDIAYLTVPLPPEYMKRHLFVVQYCTFTLIKCGKIPSRYFTIRSRTILEAYRKIQPGLIFTSNTMGTWYPLYLVTVASIIQIYPGPFRLLRFSPAQLPYCAACSDSFSFLQIFEHPVPNKHKMLD